MTYATATLLPGAGVPKVFLVHPGARLLTFEPGKPQQVTPNEAAALQREGYKFKIEGDIGTHDGRPAMVIADELATLQRLASADPGAIMEAVKPLSETARKVLAGRPDEAAKAVSDGKLDAELPSVVGWARLMGVQAVAEAAALRFVALKA
jgi:hypothetical protein